jgi:hypothetical protein
MELGAVTGVVQKVQLKITQRQFIVQALLQVTQCFQQKLEEGMVFYVVCGKPVNQFNNVKGIGNEVKVVLNVKETVYCLASGDGIQIFTAGKGYLAVGKQFQVAGHLASGTAYALGNRLSFAKVGGIEGEDSVRFSQFGFLYDNGFGFIISGFCHYINLMRWLEVTITPACLQGRG